ncbi:MAG TPA: TonB family protein [Rhizomicrobium sp.]|nr:TonB family protein [Rhizomicrobium sp.]
MQQPIHALTRPTVRWTRERIAGVGFVGILHVIAISAILAGLTPQITRLIDTPIELIPVDTKPQQPQDNHIKKIDDSELPKLSDPTFAPDPVIKIDPDNTDAIRGSDIKTPPPQPSAPDTFASGVGGTHTIPAYPPLARRLGEQGSVRLSLAISAAGDVTDANVVQSSGFADLDQTAIDWVIRHWKYKPATHGGVAVPSQSLAIVAFNLQNAR